MAAQGGLGDIIGNRIGVPALAAHASVASNGADGSLGQIGPFPYNIRVRSAWWTPTGADQGANTASYRQLSLRNGGTAGTGTAVVASLNLTASKASLAPAEMTVDTTVTLASGAVLVASQATVGGTDATGTVLRAGQFALAYEII